EEIKTVSGETRTADTLPQKKSESSAAMAAMRGLFGASFVELGAYRGYRDGSGRHILSNTLTGYGAVADTLVYAFAQDGEDNDGAITAVSAEKIVALINRSGENAPLSASSIAAALASRTVFLACRLRQDHACCRRRADTDRASPLSAAAAPADLR
ncbi:MAG: hypothetical protein ACLTTQ_07335, partial [Christensenellales bacterium]